MGSILNTIKKLLGIDASYTHFDTDIIIDINTVFGILYQLGVNKHYAIQDASNTWDEYLDDPIMYEMIKTYMYLKVKMMFDPPQSSSLTSAIDTQIRELESRINYSLDTGESK